MEIFPELFGLPCKKKTIFGFFHWKFKLNKAKTVEDNDYNKTLMELFECLCVFKRRNQILIKLVDLLQDDYLN